MYANNETGVIQPIAEAAALAHEFGGLLHCDAIQAAGKLPVSLSALGADLLTLSAHKIGGPQGIGALVLRDGLELGTLLRGGGQERRRRAGTENVAGISGFGVAARLAAERLADFSKIAVCAIRWKRASLRLRLTQRSMAPVTAPGQYQLHRPADGHRRNAGDDARSRRNCRECRIGLLQRESDPEPRIARHGL